MDRVNVHIRWMIRCDMAAVLDIEEKSFPFPWVEEDFLRCLRQRNCIGMVCEVGPRVVGFMVYELQPKKLRLLNMAVHPDYRRKQVGGQMVEKLRSKLSSHRRTAMTLEVGERNLAAQQFFRSQGFVGRLLRGPRGEDDAIRFVYSLTAMERLALDVAMAEAE